MKAHTVDITCFLLFEIIILFPNSIPAQNISKFSYINPQPNSLYVSVTSNILIRQGNKIDRSSIDGSIIEAVGSKSGIHTGKIILANDSRTLIFTPAAPFQTNEDVTVTLKDGLRTTDGVDAGELSFKFHTCKSAGTQAAEYLPVTIKPSNSSLNSKRSALSVQDTSITTYLPSISIYKSGNSSPGYFFLPSSPFLEIVDNEGTPVFFQYVSGFIYDFDLQPDGELTYFVYPVNCYGLDGSGKLLRTFNTVNGFTVDVHELRVLPNEDYYIFGKRTVTVDMSQYVSGGKDSADVLDGALQEYDSGGNLIFQWDALDHYKITDIDSNIDLTQQTIDFSHFNSVEIDTDGNLLISARNLDEITKVERESGNIIWRLGGKNNQFKFINDNLGFSQQHDIRRFTNGDISIFDNGVYHPTPRSSAVEYNLDEINMTATLVSRIYHDNIFTQTEGSVELLANGNKIICWGQNLNPVLTEFTPDDSVAGEISYKTYMNTYRAFKYLWQTTLFTTSTDSINFGSITAGKPVSKQFTVYNPHDTAVTINEFYCSNSLFSTSITVPVTIQAYDSLVVPVTFNPAHDSTYTASFNLRNFGLANGLQKLIARQVILTAAVENISSAKIVTEPGQYQLYQNYPNPFNPGTIINYQIPSPGIVTLKVYDVLGRELKTLLNEFKSPGNYSINFDAGNLSSGVYFYQLKSGGYSSIKKMVLLR